MPASNKQAALEAARRNLDQLATAALTSASPDLPELLAALSRMAGEAASGGVESASIVWDQLQEQPPRNYDDIIEAIGALEQALERNASASPESNPAAVSFPPIAADPELLREF